MERPASQQDTASQPRFTYPGSALSSELQKRLRASHPSAPSLDEPQPSLDLLVTKLKSEAWCDRVAAIQALGRLTPQVPVDLIVGGMHDEHEAVRAATARVLGRLQELAPLGHLIPALHDTSWQVRATTIQALGKLGRRVPIVLLINAIHDPDEAVRASATGVLGERGDPVCIEALGLALQDRAWHVREMAVLALGRFGMLAPLEQLAIALKDEDSQVREAVESLYETQPELFNAILITRRAIVWQASNVNQLLAQDAEKRTIDTSSSTPSLLNPHNTGSDSSHTLAAGRHTPEGHITSTKTDTPSHAASRHYSHSGRWGVTRSQLRTVRQMLLYSWCLIIGYVAGYGWHLTQSNQLHPSLRGITFTSFPFGVVMPLWLHILLSILALVLCAGATWAAGDYWFERWSLISRQRSLNHQYALTPAIAQSSRERLTRRAALAGLTGVIVVGNSVAWSLLLQKKQQNFIVPGTPLYTVAVPGGALALAWSPDSTRIVSSGSDSRVQIYQSVTGAPTLSYSGHTQPVFAVAWSPDGRYIASGGADTTVQVWDAVSGKTLTVYRHHTQTIVDLAWSHDSTHIVSSAQDSSVQIWEALTGRQLTTYTGFPGERANVAWSPDGRYIAVIGLRQQLWIIAASSNNIIYTQSVPASPSNTLDLSSHSIGWSPDSTTVAFSYQSSGAVYVVKATTGSLLTTVYNNAHSSTSLSKDRESLSSPRTITSSATSNIAWSPNGLQIATGKRDRKVEVWEVATGKPAFTCQSVPYTLFSIAWSPDGKYIAGSGWNNPAVVVWQAA